MVEYSRDACSAVRLFESERRTCRRSKTAGLGTTKGFKGSGTNPETFFSYTDFLNPQRILRLDVAKNTVSDFRTPNVPADFTPFVTEQVFYTSKDGTRVPMFIAKTNRLK